MYQIVQSRNECVHTWIHKTSLLLIQLSSETDVASRRALEESIEAVFFYSAIAHHTINKQYKLYEHSQPSMSWVVIDQD